jgi:hypothetical protein
MQVSTDRTPPKSIGLAGGIHTWRDGPITFELVMSHTAFLWGGHGSMSHTSFLWGGSRIHEPHLLLWGGHGSMSHTFFLWGGHGSMSHTSFLWGGSRIGEPRLLFVGGVHGSMSHILNSAVLSRFLKVEEGRHGFETRHQAMPSEPGI